MRAPRNCAQPTNSPGGTATDVAVRRTVRRTDTGAVPTGCRARAGIAVSFLKAVNCANPHTAERGRERTRGSTSENQQQQHDTTTQRTMAARNESSWDMKATIGP